MNLKISQKVDKIAIEFTDRLREQLGKNCKEIVLFGSRARGDAHEDSDYDILVVVDRIERKTRNNVWELVAAYHREKNVLFSIILRDSMTREKERSMPLGAQIAFYGIPL